MRASRGEIKIEEILQNAGLPFEEEYSFPDLVAQGPGGRPLRFDFAVFSDEGDLEFLIEYQGAQHYEPRDLYGGKKGLFRQQYNDKQKVIYCREHGYKLVIIPYWEISFVDYDYIMKAAYGEDW